MVTAGLGYGGDAALETGGWGFWEVQCSSDRTSAWLVHMHTHSSALAHPVSVTDLSLTHTHKHRSTYKMQSSS